MISEEVHAEIAVHWLVALGHRYIQCQSCPAIWISAWISPWSPTFPPPTTVTVLWRVGLRGCFPGIIFSYTAILIIVADAPESTRASVVTPLITTGSIQLSTLFSMLRRGWSEGFPSSRPFWCLSLEPGKGVPSFKGLATVSSSRAFNSIRGMFEGASSFATTQPVGSVDGSP